jgi:hypothetical protein
MMGSMFQVTNVRLRLLWKAVTLIAENDMRGTETLVNAAPHGMTAYECPYYFRVGSSLTLRFAPWKSLAKGDRVELATVLKHPSVQRQMFREARR